MSDYSWLLCRSHGHSFLRREPWSPQECRHRSRNQYDWRPSTSHRIWPSPSHCRPHRLWSRTRYNKLYGARHASRVQSEDQPRCLRLRTTFHFELWYFPRILDRLRFCQPHLELCLENSDHPSMHYSVQHSLPYNSHPRDTSMARVTRSLRRVSVGVGTHPRYQRKRRCSPETPPNHY